MTCETEGASKAVGRRYMRDMAIAGGLYMALVIGGALVLRFVDPPQWARIVLALLPLAPVALILRAILVFINSIDEFQRRVQMEAVLISAGLTAFGTFAWGFLEEWADLPRLSVMWILPAMMLTWGVTVWLIRRRYK
jgi:hypothetical protein